jgi:hypothetical protein
LLNSLCRTSSTTTAGRPGPMRLPVRFFCFAMTLSFHLHANIWESHS